MQKVKETTDKHLVFVADSDGINTVFPMLVERLKDGRLYGEHNATLCFRQLWVCLQRRTGYPDQTFSNSFFDLRLKMFFDNNLDFYKYYRTNITYMDDKYFIRGNYDINP